MQLEELLAHFVSNFTTKILYDPVRGLPRRPVSFIHQIYPLNHLAVLKAKQTKLNDGDDDDKFSVRYLVTTEGQLLCALDGSPGRRIPQHKQIREQCLAAGHFHFSEDFSAITKITHRSGDFHPTVASLAWPIAALYLMGTTVTEPFIVEESAVSANGGFETIALHSFSIKQIASLLSEEIRAQITAANRPAAIEVPESSARIIKQFFNSGQAASKANLMTNSGEREDEDDADILPIIPCGNS